MSVTDWKDSWTCDGCLNSIPDAKRVCPICDTPRPRSASTSSENDSEGPFTPQQIHEISKGSWLYQKMIEGAQKHREAGATASTREEAKALAARLSMRQRADTARAQEQKSIEQQAEEERRLKWWREDCESAQRHGIGWMDPDMPPWK